MKSLANCSLSQLITFPTCKDNTLDISATNRPSFVEKCEALSGISDHDIVHVTAAMSLQSRHTVVCRVAQEAGAPHQ